MSMAKKNIFDGLSEAELNKLTKIKQPTFVKPMLATLTDKYFSSKDWIWEHKFDGERCIAIKKNGKVILKSRNEKEMNTEYPELVKALISQKADDFVIDGEIVALDKEGLSDFQMLQSRIHLLNVSKVAAREKNMPVYYCIFDIVYADGYDIRKLPLLARKSILKKLLTYNKILQYTDHRSPDGLLYFKEACKLHWEGLIAKKSDSIYQGIRSPYWLKFKCVADQELVIAGYTDPKGSRTGFGALLVGYYEGTKLMYAGKVGTGFNQETLEKLGKLMHSLEVEKCPFTNYEESTTGVHWIKPKLVGEFKFAEWTKGNRLRVPRYQGLREDKAAKDVIKETPK